MNLFKEPANRRWQQKFSSCAEHAPMLASEDGYLSLRAKTESGQATGHVLSQHHDSNFQNRRLSWWILVHSQKIWKFSISRFLIEFSRVTSPPEVASADMAFVGSRPQKEFTALGFGRSKQRFTGCQAQVAESSINCSISRCWLLNCFGAVSFFFVGKQMLNIWDLKKIGSVVWRFNICG